MKVEIRFPRGLLRHTSDTESHRSASDRASGHRPLQVSRVVLAIPIAARKRSGIRRIGRRRSVAVGLPDAVQRNLDLARLKDGPFIFNFFREWKVKVGTIEGLQHGYIADLQYQPGYRDEHEILRTYFAIHLRP